MACCGITRVYVVEVNMTASDDEAAGMIGGQMAVVRAEPTFECPCDSARQRPQMAGKRPMICA
ncbi:hypothetical protein WL51_03585 [Burkholderia ubonensis]|nr:hypothetical protein WL51_03585 [Burkholderia ubonensis]